MKSIKNIKRTYNGINYISISINEAIKAQNRGFELKQFNGLKSVFIKESDFLKLQYSTPYKVKLTIEKNKDEFTYFLSDIKGCFSSFKNKNDLKKYIQQEFLKIIELNHINYNITCNQMPF